MFIMPQPIKPDQILAGSICVFENVWDKTKIQEYINSIEIVTSDPNSGVKFNKAQTLIETNTGIEAKSKRTNFDLSISQYATQNEEFRKINNDFYLTTSSAVHWYSNYFDVAAFFVESFNLLKYNGGQEYQAHFDGDSITRRSVSPILYLNDDYEGGELEFTNFNLKIKPNAGSLYLFPSSYPYRHIAHPVKSGTKYAIVTWLHDRIDN